LRVGNVEEIEDKVCWVEVEIDGIIGWVVIGWVVIGGDVNDVK
jgi:hypothetical protein